MSIRFPALYWADLGISGIGHVGSPVESVKEFGRVQLRRPTPEQCSVTQIPKQVRRRGVCAAPRLYALRPADNCRDLRTHWDARGIQPRFGVVDVEMEVES